MSKGPNTDRNPYWEMLFPTPMFDINQTPAAVYMWKAEESHLCIWPKCPPAGFFILFFCLTVQVCVLTREWPSTAVFQPHSAGITHRLMKRQNPSLPFFPLSPSTFFTVFVYAHAFEWLSEWVGNLLSCDMMICRWKDVGMSTLNLSYSKLDKMWLFQSDIGPHAKPTL